MSSIRTKIAGLGTLSLLAMAVLVSPGEASAAVTTDPIAAAAGWLSTQFEDSTHLPAPTGDHFDAYVPASSFGPAFYSPSYGENADVIFGLAAAKAGGTKIATAVNYLAANIDDYADVSGSYGGPYDGSVAKAAVAAEVAGISGASATNFGGHNLLQILKSDECPTSTCAVAGPPASTIPVGSPAGIFSSISDSFVIIAEARGGGQYVPSANAVAYFLSLQCANGGFTDATTPCGAGAADVDSTSYAIMALQAVGGHSVELGHAVAWLSSQRNAAGYWVAQNLPNANSTGLAAAALGGQAVNTATSRTWLASQQIGAGAPGAGALKYADAFTPTALLAGTSPSVLATAQGLTGLVDGSSLATLSAAGSSAGTSMLAPSAAPAAASVTSGTPLTVGADGFAAGEQVGAVLNSTPVALGSVAADPGGVVSLTFIGAGHVARSGRTRSPSPARPRRSP